MHTHTHAEEPQSLSSTWEGWSKGHRVYIYLPSICCKKYKNGPLASGSMKSYQATVFIDASKMHWGTRYYPHIVPTGIAGCSKKLAKNASYVGQPAGDTEVSQLPPQRLFQTPSPHRARGRSSAEHGAPLPRAQQPPSRREHREPTGLPLLCRILLLGGKQRGLANNTLRVSSLKVIYGSVITISTLYRGFSSLAAGIGHGQKAPSRLHQHLCRP